MSKEKRLKLVVDNSVSQGEPKAKQTGEYHDTKGILPGRMIAKLASKARSASEALDEALISTPGSLRTIRTISEVLRAHAGEHSVADGSRVLEQDLFDEPIAETTSEKGHRKTLNTIIIAGNRRVYGVVNDIDHEGTLRSVSLARLPFGSDSVIPSEQVRANAILVREISAEAMVRRGEDQAIIESGDGFNVKISRHNEVLSISSNDSEGIVALNQNTFRMLEENYPAASTFLNQLDAEPHTWAKMDI